MTLFFLHTIFSTRKAQVSAEAIVIFGITLSLLAILLVLFAAKETSITYERERLKAQELTDSVASASTLAFIVGPGSNVSTRLPSTIVAEPYSLLFGNHLVITSWDGRAVSATSVAYLNASVAVPTTISVPQTAVAHFDGEVVTLR